MSNCRDLNRSAAACKPVLYAEVLEILVRPIAKALAEYGVVFIVGKK